MDDKDTGFTLPEEESAKSGFPWLGAIVVFVVLAIGAVWVMHERAVRKVQEAAAAVLEKQITDAQADLEASRNRVFEITHQLETMKQAIQSGQIKAKDKQKAVDDYNKLAADQRAERDKAKALADQYNEKVTALHQLQN